MWSTTGTGFHVVASFGRIGISNSIHMLAIALALILGVGTMHRVSAR
jgi:hypothetical protein